MSRVRVRYAFASALAVLLSGPLSAQVRQTVGPARCVDCHDHRDEKEWWQTKDGDGKGKQHMKADRQLEDPKAAQYSKAIGLADVYDVKGSCVSCHATVVAGSADFGVSCESCHGPGREYLTPHQTKGAYAGAVALGMSDIKEKPEAWAKTCLGCHVVASRPNMQALITAGHSSGSDFDLARKFPAVAQHFTSKYQPAQIAAAASLFRPASTPVAAPLTVPVPPVAATIPATTAAAAANAAAPVSRPETPHTAPVPLPPIAPVAPERAALPGAQTPVATSTPTSAGPPAIASIAPDARVASLQGRVAQWLTQLLATGAYASVTAPPPLRRVYRGRDAELLRLQDDVIRLALEALATPPRSPRQ